MMPQLPANGTPARGHGDNKIVANTNDDRDVEEMEMQVSEQQPAFP